MRSLLIYAGAVGQLQCPANSTQGLIQPAVFQDPGLLGTVTNSACSQPVILSVNGSEQLNGSSVLFLPNSASLTVGNVSSSYYFQSSGRGNASVTDGKGTRVTADGESSYMLELPSGFKAQVKLGKSVTPSAPLGSSNVSNQTLLHRRHLAGLPSDACTCYEHSLSPTTVSSFLLLLGHPVFSTNTSGLLLLQMLTKRLVALY